MAENQQEAKARERAVAEMTIVFRGLRIREKKAKEMAENAIKMAFDMSTHCAMNPQEAIDALTACAKSWRLEFVA
jgi:hypothetical protein